MEKHNVWMSVSDLMTGLMVIFLFVSIAYMHRANEKEQPKKDVINEYADIRHRLDSTLKYEFALDTVHGELIVSNLTIRFTQAETLFRQGRWDLTDDYKSVLDNVMPRYFDILLSADTTIRNNIKEINIEGHTDDLAYPSIYRRDPKYTANLILSQNRANEVVKYIKNMSYYAQLDSADRELLDHWIISTGYSYVRALDAEGKYVYETKQPIDREKSRRVEVHLVTNDSKIINKLEKLSND